MRVETLENHRESQDLPSRSSAVSRFHGFDILPCQKKKALVCQWSDVRYFHSLVSLPPHGKWRPILLGLIERPPFAEAAFVATPVMGLRMPSSSPCKLQGAAHGGNLSQEPPQPLCSSLLLCDTSCF